MSTSIVCCLCGGAAQEVTLDRATDRTTLDVCHCNSCRTITGLLCSSYCRLESRPQKFDDLVAYQQSDCITRYFCKTCGAHVFAHVKKHDQYLVATGLLEGDSPKLESLQHWKIGDTLDGGLSAFLPGAFPDTASECWLQIVPSDHQIRAEADQHSKPPHSDLTGDPRKLQARCHCGGIEFYIAPPDSSSANASSPWPDLLVPYHSGSSQNTEDVKWWIRDNGTKYLAGTCACRSCRLSSGFPIQTWTFVSKSNISKPDGSPLTFDLDTMQQYESSPKIYREFCNRCGATVFWHCDERPLVMDVSVGLLRAKSGARAEEWLEWDSSGRVSFAEDAADKMLIQWLQDGLRNKGHEKVCS